MLDIKFIRNNPKVVKEAAKNKKIAVDVDELLTLDDRRKELQIQIDNLNAKRNDISKQTSGAKPTAEEIQEVKKLKTDLTSLEAEYREVKNNWQSLMDLVPNIPTEDTPVGLEEEDNLVLRQHGAIPEFDFAPKEHWDLGAQLDVIDNERAGKVSGSRFTYLKGELVMLQFALVQHVLNITTNKDTLAAIIKDANLDVPTTPFIPVIPPAVIKREALQKMARLEPQEDRYYLPEDDAFLVGSAEHTLGAMHMGETLEEKDLPLRYIGISPSFRREAGSHGKDVRGILRLHQFDKVEMESLTVAEQSLQEQGLLVAIQEHIMQTLELPYQVVLKCTGDMGSPDARAIDIETWMPGQNKYRETHTADLMTDYQSRRLKTKVKRAQGGLEYVHMNDATASAIGRTIIAIMENYQQADGSVTIPAVLHPYLPFTAITPKS